MIEIAIEMDVDLEAKEVVVAGTRIAQILVLDPVAGPKDPSIKNRLCRPLELRLRPVLQKLSGVAKSREVGLVLRASGF